MGEKYSKTQKDLIMLYGDLLGNPLSPEEKAGLRSALAAAGGDIEGAADLLSPDTKTRVLALSAMGFKLSVELGKLNQRGIFALFLEEGKAAHLVDHFLYEPSVLFAVGNESLISDEVSPVFTSLVDFKAVGCEGILIADRALDVLLRDKDVRNAIELQRVLIVSDLVKSGATVKPATRAEKSLVSECAEQQPSKRVFISGSRSQRSIPKVVQDSLEAIIEQGIEILIGDSNKGVDSEVIDFLRVPLYEHVTIYTISNSPRVYSEPEWQTLTIEADASLKPQQRQMVKDRAMANDANWGLGLFNPIEKNRYGALQVSAGTLRNAIQMLLQGKMVKFFYMFEGEMNCRNLKKLEDLESVIKGYQFEKLDNSEAERIRTARGVSADEDPARVKSKKIMDKYRLLLKEEKKLSGSPGSGASCERTERHGGSEQLTEPERHGGSEQLTEPVQLSLFDSESMPPRRPS